MASAPQPLPSTLPDHLLSSPDSHHYKSSYDICLRLESKLQSELATKKLKKDIETLKLPLIYCRILGLLLHHAPTEHARRQVHKEILSCGGEDEKLLRLGQMYNDHFIRACVYTVSRSMYIFGQLVSHQVRLNKGRTPAPSSHASRPSFDETIDEVEWLLKHAPQTHSNAKTLALIRDEYRCVISGRYDVMSVEQNKVIPPDTVTPLSATQLAHIIPESTNTDLDLLDKAGCAATVWTIFKNFGYPNISNELNGNDVHRMENVFTCGPDFHIFFDTLRIWLSPTEIPHRYKLEGRMQGYTTGLGPFITLSSTDPERLPPPSPDYLALHAACAKIAHLSGAGVYIDKILSDLEEIGVLAEDGTSANLLEHALYATNRVVSCTV